MSTSRANSSVATSTPAPTSTICPSVISDSTGASEKARSVMSASSAAGADTTVPRWNADQTTRERLTLPSVGASRTLAIARSASGRRPMVTHAAETKPASSRSATSLHTGSSASSSADSPGAIPSSRSPRSNVVAAANQSIALMRM